ncbi:hypothetical protein BSL78_09257 [Apostichopus japonicus]|uniref:Uncharacterized protein n=1 Tax=Stichopus japonicus TaxID=307972 RepID=A0A2G8L0Y0_STIJA|nr:hypothetical protein BSL78_09257 [Apostichopus japonicus]
MGLDVGAIRIVVTASAVLNSMENPSAKQSYKSELNVSYRKEGLNMLLTAYVPVTQVLYVDWFNTIEGQMEEHRPIGTGMDKITCDVKPSDGEIPSAFNRSVELFGHSALEM